MEIDLIFKIAAVGIVVSILNQVLVRSGREEQATMTSLAALVVVLMIVVQELRKVAPFAIVCALLGAVLPQHGAGQASLLALAGCVGLLLTAMTVLTPVMTFLRRLASLAGVNPALLAPVLKAAAVGLLTPLTE